MLITKRGVWGPIGSDPVSSLTVPPAASLQSLTSTPSMLRFLQTYELWGNEESDWVDLWVKVREVCWALTYLIQTHKTIPKQKWKASDIFYSLYSFSFSRMSYNWQHAVYNFFQSSLFFLITLIQISSISFCDLIISFYYWIIFCYVDVP